MKIDIEEIKKINLGPNDVLVVKYDMSRPERYEKIFMNHFKDIFPNNKLLMIPVHMDIIKVITEELKNG
jgi:hypothetical protein